MEDGLIERMFLPLTIKVERGGKTFYYDLRASAPDCPRSTCAFARDGECCPLKRPERKCTNEK